MKLTLSIIVFSLLLQCRNSSTVNSSENSTKEDVILEKEIMDVEKWWKDTTSEAATTKAGEYELEIFRTVWINYDSFFDVLKESPKQEDTNEANHLNITLPLPNYQTEEFAMHQVQVMSPELAEKYPQIRTYEGRSLTNPTTSIRLDFGENGASYMIIKAGEQIFLEPVTQGNREIYIIYYKKDVKKHPIDFEKPTR